MNAVVAVRQLTKRYGSLSAVDGVSFHVEEGEIFGILGPNGAGKTTTVEMIEGLRRPDSGSVSVLGMDPQTEGRAIKERIGVQLQTATLYDRIRVHEAIDLFAGYYQSAVPTVTLLEEFALVDKADTFVGKLSGGQRQRLALTLAVVNDPSLIFLDEPTTGLDPQARRNMWDIIRSLRKRGKTTVMTTHSMEEAEELCHRVAILDHGKIIALDTPNGDLGRQLAVTRGDRRRRRGIAQGDRGGRPPRHGCPCRRQADLAYDRGVRRPDPAGSSRR